MDAIIPEYSLSSIVFNFPAAILSVIRATSTGSPPSCLISIRTIKMLRAINNNIPITIKIISVLVVLLISSSASIVICSTKASTRGSISCIAARKSPN